MSLRPLNTALARYKWRHRLFIGKQIKVDLGGVGKLSQEAMWEYGAVRFLLDLVQTPRGFERLRRCAACSAVIRPNFRGRVRVFCNDACKQRDYDTNPAQREKKRKYMRQYYADWIKGGG